jgi:hypothetical protein
MITDLVTELVSAATALIGELGSVFTNVFSIFYDGADFTLIGQVIVATAGFALAWAGVRLVLTYVGKLLNASRGGRR